MQGQAAALRGRGDDFSVAIASLARSPTRRTACCGCSTARTSPSATSCATAARLRRALRALRAAERHDQERGRGLRDDRRAQRGARRDLPDLPDLPARVARDADPARAVRDRHRPGRRRAAARGARADADAASRSSASRRSSTRSSPRLDAGDRRRARRACEATQQAARRRPAAAARGLRPLARRLQPDPRGVRRCTSARSPRCSANVAAASNGVFFDPAPARRSTTCAPRRRWPPRRSRPIRAGCRSRANNPYFKPGGYASSSRPRVVRDPQCSFGINAFLDPTSPASPAFNSHGRRRRCARPGVLRPPPAVCLQRPDRHRVGPGRAVQRAGAVPVDRRALRAVASTCTCASSRRACAAAMLRAARGQLRVSGLKSVARRAALGAREETRQRSRG